MESLADFQYYFTGEREIDVFLVSALGQETAPCATTPSEPTQATRVKRAWRAARKIGPCNKDSNTLANIWYDADHSAMEQVISQAKWQFSERYKTAYPPKIAPADKLLFRCYREIEERHLTCHNIRKVKNQLNEFADLEEEEAYATSDRRTWKRKT